MRESKTKEVQRIINEYIIKEKINLLNPLPNGKSQEWIKREDFPPRTKMYDINNAIYEIRSKTGQLTKGNIKNGLRAITKPSFTEFHTICLKNNLERSAPLYEKIACDTICSALKKLSPGGVALFIGTPTPLCASNASYDSMSIDNFEVAIILKHTTEFPVKLIIGSAMDEKKALFKGQLWKSLNSTKDFEVSIGRVDKYTFREHVEELAKNYPLVKVVLMTSGVWKDRYPIFGIDRNFEEPSLELTSKYDNLHILAMTRGGIKDLNYYSFPIRYLHNGKNIILKDNTNNPFEITVTPEMKHIKDFIEDRCTKDNRCIKDNKWRCSAGELYKNYISWCSETTQEAVGKKTFGKLMKQNHYDQFKSGSVRYWVGVKIK